MKLKIENINDGLYLVLNELVEKKVLDDKHIVIFGDNRPAQIACNVLQKSGYSIHAVLDNNVSKINLMKEGKLLPQNGLMIPVTPEELLKEYDEKIVVLIASKYYSEMCKQLESLGYPEEKHVIRLENFENFHAELDKIKVDKDKIISVEEMCKIEYDILKYWDDFCNKHQLRHYICGGTMLGAERHKGFIPWDDDIDVFMPVPDYLKMLELFEENDDYVLLNKDNCENYYYMFTRLVYKKTVLEEVNYPFKSAMGINIDIFPVSGFPSDDEEVKRFATEIEKTVAEWNELWYQYSFLEERNEKYRQLSSRIQDIMLRYDFDESETVGYILTGKLEKELLPRSCFDGEVDILFEDRMFKVPVGYKTYLRNLYGDYMELPPEKDRKCKHLFKAYWI